MLWSPMMQEIERLVVLDELVFIQHRLSAGKLNVIFYHNQEFSMEGDALEMEVREANNGKVSKHQCNAMRCNFAIWDLFPAKSIR